MILLRWSLAALAAAFTLLRTVPPEDTINQILGRPTDRSITLSVLSSAEIEAYVEFGKTRQTWDGKTATTIVKANAPTEIELKGLQPNTRYVYRLMSRHPGEPGYRAGTEGTFHTQRAPGSTYTFALQGDSHPERSGKMYGADLYRVTMQNVAKDPPDFYITLGDDFSIERLISRKTIDQTGVDRVYAHQRPFLSMVGSSSSLFLVNGNHEQAARYLLDGTPNNPAVMAGRARTRYFPLPAPDGFYTGDEEMVDHIGLLRDYYAWSWGDALFVVIDPYWHSSVAVDNEAGAEHQDKDAKSKGRRDQWDITLGDAQYKWLTKTLTESRARFKFVFSHHVLGTGRGGVECATGFEWGGLDRRGVSAFAQKRPGWELPIHQLMVKTGVTIFFQGHDHIYARQELDGVVYQSTPNPADSTYTAFNRQAYRSGDVLPNSGHLRVTVAPESVRVDYVRSFLPKDETEKVRNGEVAHSYTVKARFPVGK